MNVVNWYVVFVTFIFCAFNLIFMQWKRIKNANKFYNKLKNIYPETGKKKICFIIMVLSCLFLGICVNNGKLTTLYILKRVCLIAILFPMAVIDFKSNKIPNQLILAALFCRMIILVLEMILKPDDFVKTIISELISGVILVLISLIILLIVKNGFGMGDIKLFFVMAIYQGFYGVYHAVMASLYVACGISIFLLLTKRKTKKDVIAFGPSALIGTYLSVFITGA